MQRILSTQREPLKLAGPQLFVDWRLVDPGTLNWVDPGTLNSTDGATVMSQWGSKYIEPIPVAQTPFGVRLEAQSAHIVVPTFPMDEPWEEGAYLMYVSTVVLDEGKYKLWYVVIPLDRHEDPQLPWGYDDGWLLCYAESEDGETWIKPKLDLLDYKGHRSNIVFGRELGMFASGSVFVDENAPPAERFKLIYRRFIDVADGERDDFLDRQTARFGDDQDDYTLGGRRNAPNSFATTGGAISADGIHWTVLDEPLMMYASDQLNGAFWDDDIEKYVGYFRMMRGGRRSVGRSETADFSIWPTPHPVLEVPLSEHPSTDVMHCPVQKYPGTSDVYLMWANIFHLNTNLRDVSLAVSVDGHYWNWVPGLVSSPTDGSTDAPFEEIEVCFGILDLPDERIGVPIVAYERPYKYPRFGIEQLGKPGYATWKRHRISAIVAEDHGQFTTRIIHVDGNELSINVTTRGTGGAVRVEALDETGNPLPGFGLEDALYVSGDHLDARQLWRERSISELRGTNLKLRFTMQYARIFSLEFVD